MNRRWTGGEGRGSSTYTLTERQRVDDLLRRHIGKRNATSQAMLASAAGLQGRTLRAILHDLDGAGMAICAPSDGRLYLAEFLEESQRQVRQLRSRANAMTDRANRQEAFAGELPRNQGYLFDIDDDDGDDL